MRTILTLLVLSISLLLNAQTREFERDSTRFVVFQLKDGKEVLSYIVKDGTLDFLAVGSGGRLSIDDVRFVLDGAVLEVDYTTENGKHKDLFISENGRWTKLDQERKVSKLKVRRYYDTQ